MQKYEELIARLQSKRSCTVCIGAGVKYNGKECGGCSGAGEVLHYGNTGKQAAEAITALCGELEEAMEALRETNLFVDRLMHTHVASDMCEEERVKASWQWFRDNGGTLACIADITDKNRAIYATHKEKKDG